MRIVPLKRSSAGARPAPHILLGAAARPDEEGGASAEEIIAAAAVVAGLVPRLGLPQPASVASDDGGGELVLEIDPHATAIALAYEQALPGAGLGKIDVTAKEIAARRAQLGEMLRLYGTAAQFHGRVTGTRRALHAAQRRLLRRLLGKIRALIDDETLSRAFRDRLASDAAELLQRANRLREERTARRAKTLRLRARTDAQLAEIERQKKLLRTMIDLRAGKEVDPEEAGEALETFEALTAKREDRRRER